MLTKVTYDAHGRITKVIQQDVSAGRRLLELNYDYDAVGNRRRVLARSAYDADSPGIDINGITNPDFEDGDFGWKRGMAGPSCQAERMAARSAPSSTWTARRS